MTNLSVITSELNKVLVKFEQLGIVPLIWVLITIQFAFLIVMRPLFPEYWEAGWTSVVMIYILITLVYYQISKEIPKEYEMTHTTLQEGMLLFPIGFISFYIFLLILKQFGLFPSPNIPAGVLISNVILQCIVIAPSEEIMFRGAIYHGLKWKTKSRWFSIIISSAIFSGFHLGVYAQFNFNWPMLITAFLMGCLFCVMTDKFGLVVPMACHACWNSVAVGLQIITPDPFIQSVFIALSIIIICVFIIVKWYKKKTLHVKETAHGTSC